MGQRKGQVILRVEHLNVSFGGLEAIKGFSMEINEGEILGLIGPNGAGKTTVFNVITGHYRPTSGRVSLGGRDITGLAPHQITKLGIARTFQNIRLFSGLSVLDNVRVAYHLRRRASFWSAIFRTPGFLAEEHAIYERAMELLQRVGLDHLRNESASSLPYGQQRRLEIARALATSPKLLLLDEPAAGMNPEETQGLMHFILRIRGEFGVTVFLIEHDMRLVMGICERIRVLDYGVSIAEGSPQEIQRDPRVIQAYLGKGENHSADC